MGGGRGEIPLGIHTMFLALDLRQLFPYNHHGEEGGWVRLSIMNVFSVTDQRCGEPTNGSLVGPTSTCECKVHGSPSECPPPFDCSKYSHVYLL